MGESQKSEISVYSPELESFSVETPGGRVHIRWDHEASATANAQLAFFAEFLATAGLYESWVSSCPLRYSSGMTSHKRDVLGAWFLSILAGHHRYSHITGLRGDGVSPQILGMSKIIELDLGHSDANFSSILSGQHLFRRLGVDYYLPHFVVTNRAFPAPPHRIAFRHVGSAGEMQVTEFGREPFLVRNMAVILFMISFCVIFAVLLGKFHFISL